MLYFQRVLHTELLNCRYAAPSPRGKHSSRAGQTETARFLQMPYAFLVNPLSKVDAEHKVVYAYNILYKRTQRMHPSPLSLLSARVSHHSFADEPLFLLCRRYDLDLRYSDHRRVARVLSDMAVAEPGPNLQNQRFRSAAGA